MPPLTRWCIKTALVHFILALLVGAALLARPVLGLPAWLLALNPVYFHLLMVGWVTQLIFGVVYWMFPKLSKERPRGSERLGWAAYGLLNAGLLLRAVSEPLAAAGSAPWGPPLALSALLQLAAGWAFVVNTWGRVKER
jgi:hypothetical protein